MLLVVDDEEGPRTSLKVVFKNDYEVLLASNGMDALKLATANRVDVAILDILMHGMSGVDVLRELKQMDQDIEVIMLTAYETIETARQALRLGAREYLNKPFDIPALRAAVGNALARRRASVELKSTHARLKELQDEISRSSPAPAVPKAGDTAGNILHDLNSPLTVINGFIELLHRQVQSAAKIEGVEMENVKSNIARVHGQVVRCLEISRRYLGVRRAAHEQLTGRASVNEVLVDLQELLGKHPSAEGSQLTISELEDHTHAAITGTDLLRVLINLALNGLQSGPAPLRIDVVAQAIAAGFDVGAFKDGDDERFVASEKFSPAAPHVAISVRDNGPGMPAEIVRRIFNEPLTTKPAGMGTGLGLGSVKELVVGAKGAVRLTTKPGQGSTFTVFLPLAS